MADELIVAPEAEEDLAEAYGWYEGQRVGLGEQLWVVSMLVALRPSARPSCMLCFARPTRRALILRQKVSANPARACL
jgi:hypothetical protein